MRGIEREAIAAYLNSQASGEPSRRTLVIESTTAITADAFISSGPDRKELASSLPEATSAVIDDFIRARNGQSRDENGQLAARGCVDEEAVARVLRHDFFAQRPPKSLDRNAFREWVAEQAALADKGLEDGTATLSAITAATVAAIVPHLPEAPKSWVVCGGGAHNATLMRMLAQRLAPASVETADEAGWNADAIEAQAFAYMAVRALRGLPITFPTTTGAFEAMTGGVLVEPRRVLM